MDAGDEGSNARTQELDAEQIHNMINMSMSHAHDVVSSWMLPPSDNKAKPTLPSMNDREFEKLVMRPPRLGVGAVAPATSAAAPHKDTSRLRYKLTGQKRGRGDDAGSTSNANPNGKGKERAHVSESSDEEESRASVFKKPKLNGIKTLLKGSVAGGQNGIRKDSVSPVKAGGSGHVQSVVQDGHIVEKTQILTKTNEDPDATDEEDGGAEVWTGVSTSSIMELPPESQTANGIASSSKVTPSPKEPAFTSVGSLLARLQPTAPVSAMNQTPLSTPHPTISPPSSIASSQLLNGLQSPPILNRSYSPNCHPPALNGNADGPRRKRKKKKKKKTAVPARTEP
ncbi:hypothetical protein FRB98_001104 [Tulasnella sp. 332]|nr:hypothetical protein FRB98_001104 [Tulasnella sp. 332]